MDPCDPVLSFQDEDNSQSTSYQFATVPGPDSLVGIPLKQIGIEKGYPIYQPPGRFDSWVWSALKEFDRDMYVSIKNSTRRPAGVHGMYNTLSQFGGPTKDLSKLSRDDRQILKSAIEEAREAFKLPTPVTPLKLTEAVEKLEHNTSAGYTFRQCKKGDVLDEIYHAAKKLRHNMKKDIKRGSSNPSRIRFPYCMAAQRGGMSSDYHEKVKTRLVWIYPAEILAIEAIYAFPLYDAYASWRDSPMLYGNDPDRMVSSWFTKCQKQEEDYLVGIDMNAFDSRANPHLIKEAFKIAFENIFPMTAQQQKAYYNAPRSEQIKSYNKRARKMKVIREALCWYFINTPLLMPDGRCWRKERGVPSGTAFTQLIDSIVNFIQIVFAAKKQQAKIRNLAVLGDDSGFCTRTWDMAKATEDLEILQGSLSVDKSLQTQKTSAFKLLGFYYRGGTRWRPEQDWFQQALCPESFVPNLPTSFGRLYGLYMAGAKHNLRFCQFMNFYQSGYPLPDKGEIPMSMRRYLTKVMNLQLPAFWSLTLRQSLNPE